MSDGAGAPQQARGAGPPSYAAALATGIGAKGSRGAGGGQPADVKGAKGGGQPAVAKGGKAPPAEAQAGGGGPFAPPCWEFAKTGECRFGERCRFRHARNDAAAPACWDFATRGCSREMCRFRHVAPCSIEGCRDGSCALAHPPREQRQKGAPSQPLGNAVGGKGSGMAASVFFFGEGQHAGTPIVRSGRVQRKGGLHPAFPFAGEAQALAMEVLLGEEGTARSVVRHAFLQELWAMWTACDEQLPLPPTEQGVADFRVCPTCGEVVQSQGALERHARDHKAAWRAQQVSGARRAATHLYNLYKKGLQEEYDAGYGAVWAEWEASVEIVEVTDSDEGSEMESVPSPAGPAEQEGEQAAEINPQEKPRNPQDAPRSATAEGAQGADTQPVPPPKGEQVVEGGPRAEEERSPEPAPDQGGPVQGEDTGETAKRRRTRVPMDEDAAPQADGPGARPDSTQPGAGTGEQAIRALHSDMVARQQAARGAPDGCCRMGVQAKSGRHKADCLYQPANLAALAEGRVPPTRWYTHLGSDPPLLIGQAAAGPPVPLPPVQQGQGAGGNAAADAEMEALPFTLAELATLRVPKLERIPREAQLAVGGQLAKVMRTAATGSTAGWLHLFAFPSLVLCRCPRGGKKNITATLRRRAHMWMRGEFSTLWAEAVEIAAGRVEKERVRFMVDIEDGGVGAHLGLGTDVESVEQLDDATVKEVLKHGKTRWFGRAIAALSAAKVASVTEDSLRTMREKHPEAAPPPGLQGVQRQEVDSPHVTKEAVKKALRSMPRGTAAGPSGLTAQHLLDLLGPACPLAEPLAAAVGCLAAGKMAESARPFWYGAKLVALEKKDGGLRPIACGEILRRLAAKVLMADKEVKKAIEKALLGATQTGVGRKAGADAMLTSMRRIGALYMSEGPGKGVVKLDLKNAFNLVDRQSILLAVAEEVPALARYAEAAYGARSQLTFGHEVVWSESGVQQGDPLGPLFFSLVLKKVLERVERGMGELEGDFLEARSFYLDDGALAGTWQALANWVALFEREGAQAGMFLNREKSEVVVHPVEAVPGQFQGMKHKLLDNWELLGAPLGRPEAVAAAVERALEKVDKKSRAISTLPDPHVALALLRTCAGFATVVSLMRSTGSVGDYAKVDRSTRAALGNILGAELDEETWAQASLPTRLGGLGLHSCSSTAAIAGVAAALSGWEAGQDLMSTETRARVSQAADPLCQAAVNCPHLAQHPTVLTKVQDAQRVGAEQKPRQQKIWSAEVAQLRREAIMEVADERKQARMQSCAARHSAAWLYGSYDAPEWMWLSPAEFNVAVRMRLGLPLTAHVGKCRLCGDADADVMGDHSLCCMSGGLRTRAHTALRNEVAAVAREALLTPALEVQPFTQPAHTGLRLDVAYQRGGKLRLIDVAITFPLKPTGGSRRKAAEGPGGAATAYEAVKRGKYTRAVEQEAPLLAMELVPIVVDTLGAWGDSAGPELRALISALHRRYDWESYPSLAQLVYHRLSFTVMRAVSRIAMANTLVSLEPGMPEADGEEEREEASIDEDEESSGSDPSDSGSAGADSDSSDPPPPEGGNRQEQAGAQPAPKPAAKPAAKPAPKPGAAPSADEREREARQKAVQAAEAAALLRAEAEQKEAARVAEVRAQRIVTQAVAAELIRKNDEKRKAAEAERAEVWRRTATPSAKPASRAPEAKAGKRKPSVKLVVKKPAGLGRQGAASNRSGEGSTTVSSPSCVILVDSPSKGGAGGVSSPVSPAILVPQAATGRGCSNPSRAASARPAGGRQEAALPPLQRYGPYAPPAAPGGRSSAGGQAQLAGQGGDNGQHCAGSAAEAQEGKRGVITIPSGEGATQASNSCRSRLGNASAAFPINAAAPLSQPVIVDPSSELHPYT
ncbi:Retrotransposable element SLACS 132 kDa protein [Diplonema papillatum]|nr:Retrotransposable element SLACS 132 kDa protein [Diplonema papillatum]